MDDTIGDYSIRIDNDRYDLKKVAKRAAILAVSLEIHETSILHDPDVTIVISKLPKALRISIRWNEEAEESEFYIQYDTDKLRLFGRIKNLLEESLA